MAILRVFLVFFFIFASYQQVNATYNVDAVIDYIEFCKDLMQKHGITYETLTQNFQDQSEAYKAFIIECIDALPDYGLAPVGNDQDFLEYMKWCIDNLGKLKELYGEDLQKYVEFCLAALKNLKFKIDTSLFEHKGDGKGIVDYLQWCKDLIKNYGPEVFKKGSIAFKNFKKSALRHLQDFELDEAHFQTWGEQGYPGKAKIEQLIQDCLQLLAEGGYKGSWTRYVQACLQLLGKYNLAAYEFLFEGEGAAIIAKWQQKLADIMTLVSEHTMKIKKKYSHKKFSFPRKTYPRPSKGHFSGFLNRFSRAEVAQGAEEVQGQATTTTTTESSSSNNEGLIIGLLVMVACSLVANIVIVALFFSKRQSQDRI